MYGIMGENLSDVETLTVLIHRLAHSDSLQVKKKGYNGCGEMLRKGAKQLALFKAQNCSRFIVCHDADGPDPKPKYELVRGRIVEPAGMNKHVCILIPVQELEAWILADIECAAKIFASWLPSPIHNPERIARPKERLEQLSRDGGGRPRYSHATHNERMAKYLDLRKVAKKCPSFALLADFVRNPSKSN